MSIEEQILKNIFDYHYEYGIDAHIKRAQLYEYRDHHKEETLPAGLIDLALHKLIKNNDIAVRCHDGTELGREIPCYGMEDSTYYRKLEQSANDIAQIDDLYQIVELSDTDKIQASLSDITEAVEQSNELTEEARNIAETLNDCNKILDRRKGKVIKNLLNFIIKLLKKLLDICVKLGIKVFDKKIIETINSLSELI